MKPITHITFKNTYTVTDPDSLVKQDEVLNITEDLYIIRSTYKQRNYAGRNDETNEAIYENTFKPCFKLMSKAFSLARLEANEYEMCLIAWDADILIVVLSLMHYIIILIHYKCVTMMVD